MKFSKWLPAILFLLSASYVFAQNASVPQLVNYQGRLTDAAGDPLPTAEYDIAFTIYDADGSVGNEGNVVWGQVTYGAVPVVQGHFNVLLGPTDNETPPRGIAYVFTEPNRYLEITLVGTGPGGSDEVIAPRQGIQSTPFAFAALGSVPIGGIVAYTGDLTLLPDNWKVCDGTQIVDVDSPLNGTFSPNLVNRFLWGAGPNFANIIGGSDIHSHSSGSLTPFFPLQSVGSWIGRTLASSAPAFHPNLFAPQIDNNESAPYNSHGHTSGSVFGSTSSAFDRPPYWSVYFIMRTK